MQNTSEGGRAKTRDELDRKFNTEGCMPVIYMPGLDHLHGKFVIAIRQTTKSRNIFQKVEPTKIVSYLSIEFNANTGFVKGGMKVFENIEYFEYDEFENSVLRERDFEHGYDVTYSKEGEYGYVYMGDLEFLVNVLNIKNSGHKIYLVDSRRIVYTAKVTSFGSNSNQSLRVKNNIYLKTDNTEGGFSMTENIESATRFSPYMKDVFMAATKSMNLEITWNSEILSCKIQ